MSKQKPTIFVEKVVSGSSLLCSAIEVTEKSIENVSNKLKCARLFENRKIGFGFAFPIHFQNVRMVTPSFTSDKMNVKSSAF